MRKPLRKLLTMSDRLAFFRQWIADPLGVAAVAPSGRALARLVVRDLDAQSPVIELGAGTGALTQALVSHGVPEDRLTLIERNDGFASRLEIRFPQARVLRADALDLRRMSVPSGDGRPGAVVSGLPILTMPPRIAGGILEGAFAQLRPGGVFVQFTYAMRCPVPPRLLARLGLVAERRGIALINLPPAAVYLIRRAADEARQAA